MAQQEAKEMLTEEQFESYFSEKKDVLDTYFRTGYLFNPCLFGKFMDPSEPFPLWDYSPYDIWPSETVALSKSRVDWSQTEDSILLCADLPGMKKEDIDVAVENGRILKINGHWNGPEEGDEETDKSKEGAEWWRKEFIRKFSLPENANVEHAHARMDDGVLEIRIPKTKPHKSHKSHDRKRTLPSLFVVEVTD